MSQKKVFVSGCYDLLHGGHVAFFKTAAAYGDLYVSVGRDENLLMLKGKKPVFSEQERLYIVKSIRYVHDAFLGSGVGMLDFEPDLRRMKPDIFIVNSDGHKPEKEALCRELGIQYVILERIPEPGLPERSSSGTKRNMRFPYRLCLAGGWLDQPWVSKVYPGPVIVAQIWPTMEFDNRSGLATSSREVAIRLWGDRYPDGNAAENARLLFGAENPPGREYISGSQDHLGLLLPGINRLYYEGSYWPSSVESEAEKDICDWLSDVLWLVKLSPRPAGYDPLREMHLEKPYVKELARSAELCWEGIKNKDVERLGKGLTGTYLSWKKILPLTVPDEIMEIMERNYFPVYPGAITSGSGGGYIIVASEKPVLNGIKIKVRY
ncbi:MAG TPA: adenylyltransferase/cytidyltransferase family protein [Bacteroidales bacterium]|nr:adenylyltransferase/cytidyltransferase family protein [Bacteroidales bacterium]